MEYKNVQVVDAHIHIHAYNMEQYGRVPFDRHEEIVNEIFDKTNYDAINLVATGFKSTYHFEKAGKVNLIDTALGYYLKEKCKQKIYLFGAFSRNYHFPEKNTKELYLEQAKFRIAAGCDGFKSLDGIFDSYREVGAKFSDSITEPYFEYLEKNNIPITIHFCGPNQVFDKNSIIYAGDEKQEEYKSIIKDVHADVEELLKKFPKLTLICAHFYFMSDDLEKAEYMLTKYENLYFDLTPDIFMYHDFNKYPDDEIRAFLKRNQHKIIYGTDIFIEEDESEKPIHYSVIREFFEKENSPFLNDLGLKPLKMDDEFLEKIYFENFKKIAGDEPRKVNPKMAIEECDCLLTDYRQWLSDKDIEFLTNIKTYFNN